MKPDEGTLEVRIEQSRNPVCLKQREDRTRTTLIVTRQNRNHGSGADRVFAFASLHQPEQAPTETTFRQRSRTCPPSCGRGIS